MTSAAGHYDQNLLASAPEVTGERRREGYTTEILTANTGKATPPLTAQSDVEAGLVTKEYNNRQLVRPVPFWRTRKGIIIILVAAIVILGAVIGGAVGGTAGKKDPKGAITVSNGPDGGEGPGIGGSPAPANSTAINSNSTTTTSPTATTTGAGSGKGIGDGAQPTSSGSPVSPDTSGDGKVADGTGPSESGTRLGISDPQLSDIVQHV